MVWRVRRDTRLADVQVRSWLWMGAAACVLLGTLWVARTLREESRAPAEPTIEPTGAVIEATDSMIGTTGGEEAEIVVGNGATSGRARRWTQEIGALAAFTAVFFIYSMAR